MVHCSRLLYAQAANNVNVTVCHSNMRLRVMRGCSQERFSR
jgi:hypothetical protein